MKNYRLNILANCGIIIVVAFLLNGCASSGIIRSSTPMTESLSNYKAVMVKASSELSDSSEEVGQLEKLVIDKLREQNKFEVITQSSSSGGSELQLNLKLVQLVKVSTSRRLMLGAGAGRALASIIGELIDAKTGKSVGKFEIEGQSSEGSIFAGTTSQAIERASEQIIEHIQKNI